MVSYMCLEVCVEGFVVDAREGLRGFGGLDSRGADGLGGAGA